MYVYTTVYLEREEGIAVEAHVAVEVEALHRLHGHQPAGLELEGGRLEVEEEGAQRAHRQGLPALEVQHRREPVEVAALVKHLLGHHLRAAHPGPKAAAHRGERRGRDEPAHHPLVLLRQLPLLIGAAARLLQRTHPEGGAGRGDSVGVVPVARLGDLQGVLAPVLRDGAREEFAEVFAVLRVARCAGEGEACEEWELVCVVCATCMSHVHLLGEEVRVDEEGRRLEMQLHGLHRLAHVDARCMVDRMIRISEVIRVYITQAN